MSKKPYGGGIINKDRKQTRDYVNNHIPFNKLLVIADDGEKLGILETNEALERTFERDLDLVVVNPNANPPVARMMDYSKHRYEQQRRQREMRRNQKTINVKEVRLSPVIGEHDLNTKFNQAKRFIDNGDKVKVTLRFRGRMIVHSKKGFEIVNQFLEMFEDSIIVEQKPRLEGRVINCVIAPNNKR